MRPGTAALAALLVASPLYAQNEAVLRDAFEGQLVTLKIDMPGTEGGVDVYPRASRPVDYAKLANRLKEYGTAIRVGDRVMVTKVKVKSKLVEFQLAGGGYGTFGDETGTSTYVPSAPKSEREKQLERAIRTETDQARKRELQSELKDLQNAREAEDRRNQASVAAADEAKRANLRQRRLEGGSRFNLRFSDRVPREMLTPEGLRTALARYVEFPESASDAQAGDGGIPQELRKGLLLREVEAMLGPAVKADERSEGSLGVSVRVYDRGSDRVTAEFVEGVLVRYGITSQ